MQFGQQTTTPLLCLLLIAVQHTVRAFDLLDLFRAPPIEVRIANALEKGRENREVAVRFAAERQRRYGDWPLLLRRDKWPSNEQARGWIHRENAREFWADRLAAIRRTDPSPSNYRGFVAMALGVAAAALLALGLVQIRHRWCEQRRKLLPTSAV